MNHSIKKEMGYEIFELLEEKPWLNICLNIIDIELFIPFLNHDVAGVPGSYNVVSLGSEQLFSLVGTYYPFACARINFIL